MIMTFKALSALLSYPCADLKTAAPEIAPILRSEALIPEAAIAGLEPLLRDLASDDLFDLQARFVFLFDRSRTLSLNLFEHVHGESRARGGAMVDLLETYRAGGFEPVGPELPDHLPILLEFLATRDLDEARVTMADAGHILEALAERLDRRGSDYAAVFRALVALAGETATDLVAALTAIEDDDPADLEALDAVYEEAQVTFGPDPNAGCPQARDMLAKIAPGPAGGRGKPAPALQERI
jgi:nitrate reductase delta subunit